jgi:hypothetical protein
MASKSRTSRTIPWSEPRPQDEAETTRLVSEYHDALTAARKSKRNIEKVRGEFAIRFTVNSLMTVARGDKRIALSVGHTNIAAHLADNDKEMAAVYRAAVKLIGKLVPKSKTVKS